MASNRELSEQADALGKELGLSVDTKGLNNQALTELVANLEKRRSAAAKSSPAPGIVAGELQPGEELKPSPAPAAAAPPPPPEKSPRPPIDGASDGSKGGPPPKVQPKGVKPKAPYVVAKGRSLTCRRGVLGPGEEIKASDVANGQAQIDHLVKSGYVVKR
jgi:hypothetical protein